VIYDEFLQIQKCLSGDRNAFQPLVERHQKTVFDIIVRMVFDKETARDLAQEAFVKAYTKLQTFDPRFPFRTWLAKIASNTAIDFLRKRKPEVLALDEPAAADEQSPQKDIIDPQLLADGLLERSELSEMVRKAVYSLEPKLRAVVVLRHFEEMDYEQISDILRIPLGTVKNRLFRARDALQLLLTPQSALKEAQS
jgi:RNA polymerase sigma-70 factor, ECF subfamily